MNHHAVCNLHERFSSRSQYLQDVSCLVARMQGAVALLCFTMNVMSDAWSSLRKLWFNFVIARNEVTKQSVSRWFTGHEIATLRSQWRHTWLIRASLTMLNTQETCWLLVLSRAIPVDRCSLSNNLPLIGQATFPIFHKWLRRAELRRSPDIY